MLPADGTKPLAKLGGELKPSKQSAWQLSEDMRLSPDTKGPAAGARRVVRTFTAGGKSGAWAIDYVLNDPRLGQHGRSPLPRHRPAAAKR